MDSIINNFDYIELLTALFFMSLTVLWLLGFFSQRYITVKWLRPFRVFSLWVKPTSEIVYKNGVCVKCYGQASSVKLFVENFVSKNKIKNLTLKVIGSDCSIHGDFSDINRKELELFLTNPDSIIKKYV